MKWSIRNFLPALGLIGVFTVFAAITVERDPRPLAAAPAAMTPLDRVPADAALFAHLTATNLWEHPAVVTLRKEYAKELDKALTEVEKETGLRPEHIQS